MIKNELNKSKKVILIGGSPMTGKTTIAKMLAAEYQYCCLSTDDIGEAIRAINKSNKYNPMGKQNYQDYYIKQKSKKLIQDTIKQHRSYWPAIQAVIKAHMQWGHPMILEGWNLYPSLIHKLPIYPGNCIWFLGNKIIFEDRMEKNSSFYENALDPVKLKEKYIRRSLWHNQRLENELKDFDYPVIHLSKSSSVQNIFQKCLNLINL